VVFDVFAFSIAPTSQGSEPPANPTRLSGRSCLRGLHICVKDVLNLLAAGADGTKCCDHPLLEADDIIAALECAARQSNHPVLRVA